MADIELREVSKRYGLTVAVDSLSLTVSAGEMVSLLGPSGCGKTTTLRMVAGLTEPDQGRVFIRGEDVTRVPVYQRHIAMVFQQLALFPHMRVYENVAFGLRMRRVPPSEERRRVKEALEMVRLQGLEGRYPDQLSGGQQQRVALARALVVSPAVLLLDEPLGSLDKKLREEMQVELKRLQRQLGITTLFVTHDQQEALVLSDRVAVMKAGCLEQFDSPVRLYEAPRTHFVADFIGVSNFIPAQVRRVEGRRVDLEAGPLRLVAESEGPLPPSGEVEVAVRPERMVLLPNGDVGPENRVPGTLTDVIYQGTVTQYYVAVGVPPRALTLVVHQQNVGGRTEGDLHLGERVWVGWEARASLLLSK